MQPQVQEIELCRTREGAELWNQGLFAFRAFVGFGVWGLGFGV